MQIISSSSWLARRGARIAALHQSLVSASGRNSHCCTHIEAHKRTHTQRGAVKASLTRPQPRSSEQLWLAVGSQSPRRQVHCGLRRTGWGHTSLLPHVVPGRYACGGRVLTGPFQSRAVSDSLEWHWAGIDGDQRPRHSGL